MVSVKAMSPILVPARMWAAWGDWLMLSWPPATTISASPAWIACPAIATARRPEPQTWLMVSAVFSFGTPADMAACRAGFWPVSAVRTCPMMTSSTSAPATFERSMAASMATLPRSAAGTVAKAPLKAPIGVRAALAIMTSVMDVSS